VESKTKARRSISPYLGPLFKKRSAALFHALCVEHWKQNVKIKSSLIFKNFPSSGQAAFQKTNGLSAIHDL
jgi:hypothetical protein